MRLAALLEKIRGSSGPVTGIELATRLGVSPAEVASMLTALRACGALAAEPPTGPALDNCSSAGSCSLSCPGPAKCSLVIDLKVTELEIRRS